MTRTAAPQTSQGQIIPSPTPLAESELELVEGTLHIDMRWEVLPDLHVSGQKITAIAETLTDLTAEHSQVRVWIRGEESYPIALAWCSALERRESRGVRINEDLRKTKEWPHFMHLETCNSHQHDALEVSHLAGLQAREHGSGSWLFGELTHGMLPWRELPVFATLNSCGLTYNPRQQYSGSAREIESRLVTGMSKRNGNDEALLHAVHLTGRHPESFHVPLGPEKTDKGKLKRAVEKLTDLQLQGIHGALRDRVVRQIEYHLR